MLRLDRPVAEYESETERRPRDKTDSNCAPTILVADDNPVNQKIAAEMLRRLGCVVHVVDDRAAAVAAAASRAFDCVLLDCQMPVLDGYEAAARIRRRHPRLPIVAVTASATTDERERCLAAGMDHHLAKPFRFTSLQALLETCLRRELPRATRVAS